ncbi:hypothetical protein SOVF_105920 [Spinacia oleracea]|nr:hypothetical protein SOVF_105920 [Spinacia oleracea]
MLVEWEQTVVRQGTKRRGLGSRTSIGANAKSPWKVRTPQEHAPWPGTHIFEVFYWSDQANRRSHISASFQS